MVNRFHRGLCIVVVGGIAFVTWPRQSLAQAPLLVVETRDGVVSAGPSAGRFDFGSLDYLSSPNLARTFSVRNAGSASITISRVQSSCGCAAVILTDRPSGKPAVIRRGATLTVRVVIDLAKVSPGALNVVTWLYSTKSEAPAATLHVIGKLRPSVSFSPVTVDFGQAAARQPLRRSLAALLDPRLVQDGFAVKLISTNPDIAVSSVFSEERSNSPDGRPAVVRTYALELAPAARLGPILGMLRFDIAGRPSPSGKDVKRAHHTSASMSGQYAALAGEVVGDISASPSALAFGVVPPGTAATRRITIAARSVSFLQGLKTASSDSTVTARLLPSADGDAFNLNMEVTLRAPKRMKVIQSDLTITTLDGQRLYIPIFAYVVGPATLPGAGRTSAADSAVGRPEGEALE